MNSTIFKLVKIFGAFSPAVADGLAAGLTFNFPDPTTTFVQQISSRIPSADARMQSSADKTK